MIRFPSGLARKAGLFFIALSTVSCATYQSKVGEARTLIQSGEFQAATDKLKPLAEKKDGDQLVFLLDYAVALQLNGDLKESNAIFLQADRLAEQLDYHSISRVAGSLITSEELVQYKGDTFEKIFINAYLAMNYLALNQLDDALVESRRMNEKYLLYRSEDKKKFEQNVFGKYLSAMIWEAGRQYDDAYIAYSEAWKLDSSIPTLKGDLIRLAKLSRRMDEYQKWKKAFSSIEENPQWYDKSMGELIVIVQQGWGPRKYPRPGAASTPALQPVYSQTHEARIQIDGDKSYTTRQIYDVQSAAIQTLDDDYGRLVAKRIGGIAAKEVLADQIRQKNELLGAVAWIAMYASDRADLRQWSTLPQTIQIVRLPLKPGTHKVSIQGLGFNNDVTADHLDTRDVEIKAGKKNFLIWRALR